MKEVILSDGSKIIHPEDRSGLIGTLLEVWYENVYRIGEFYKPQANDVVVDAGAHVGFFSIYLSKRCPDCQIVSIEASNENFPCLKENTQLYENISIHRLALGAAKGWVRTEIDTNRSIDTRIVDVNQEDPNSIAVLPVNDLLELAKTSRIAMLKMDIEGAEFEIFKIIEDQLISKIDKFCMEYHDNIKPGTLELLKKRLEPTHEVEVIPDENTGHGMLFAKIRSQ